MDDDIQICSDDRSIGRSIVKHLGREKVVENFLFERQSTRRERDINERKRERQTDKDREKREVTVYRNMKNYREREREREIQSE
jgi:hypothetical protein